MFCQPSERPQAQLCAKKLRTDHTFKGLVVSPTVMARSSQGNRKRLKSVIWRVWQGRVKLYTVVADEAFIGIGPTATWVYPPMIDILCHAQLLSPMRLCGSGGLPGQKSNPWGLRNFKVVVLQNIDPKWGEIRRETLHVNQPLMLRRTILVCMPASSVWVCSSGHMYE